MNSLTPASQADSFGIWTPVTPPAATPAPSHTHVRPKTGAPVAALTFAYAPSLFNYAFGDKREVVDLKDLPKKQRDQLIQEELAEQGKEAFRPLLDAFEGVPNLPQILNLIVYLTGDMEKK
jgi:hypothetical protein